MALGAKTFIDDKGYQYHIDSDGSGHSRLIIHNPKGVVISESSVPDTAVEALIQTFEETDDDIYY